MVIEVIVCVCVCVQSGVGGRELHNVCTGPQEGQLASMRNNIPTQLQGHILVTPEIKEGKRARENDKLLYRGFCSSQAIGNDHYNGCVYTTKLCV